MGTGNPEAAAAMYAANAQGAPMAAGVAAAAISSESGQSQQQSQPFEPARYWNNWPVYRPDGVPVPKEDNYVKLCQKYACSGHWFNPYLPTNGRPYWSQNFAARASGPRFPYRPAPPMDGRYSLEPFFQPVNTWTTYKQNPFFQGIAAQYGPVAQPMMAGDQM